MLTPEQLKLIEKREKDKLQLRKAIDELYDNQITFHHNMKWYCEAFTQEACDLLPEEAQAHLSIFLAPYRKLTTNPFATPDDMRTLENISYVISAANKEFKSVWDALSICGEQYEAFNAFLRCLQHDYPDIIARVSASLKEKKPGADLNSLTFNPIQQSMRYKLTLKEISKHVRRPTDSMVLTELLELLEQATKRLNHHVYIKDMINRLSHLQTTANTVPVKNISDELNLMLSVDTLQPYVRAAAEHSASYRLAMLKYMHRELVQTADVAASARWFSLFRSTNPMLTSLQSMTKEVEKRYLAEMQLLPNT